MGNEENRISKMDFALKAIRETVLHNKDDYIFTFKDTPLVSTVRIPKGFSNLPSEKKKIIREKSKKILRKNTLFSDSFFSNLFSCYRIKKRERNINPRILELIAYIKANGIYTESIFRREGNRAEYKQIIANLDTINFKDHGIYELASALKHYIRDIMDGLFNADLATKIFDFIKKDDTKNASLHCKYLIYTMTDDQRTLLYNLKDLLQT